MSCIFCMSKNSHTDRRGLRSLPFRIFCTSKNSHTRAVRRVAGGLCEAAGRSVRVAFCRPSEFLPPQKKIKLFSSFPPYGGCADGEKYVILVTSM